MDDSTGGKPVRAAGAKALARYLHEEMSNGRLKDGARLPPERDLSQQFGASRGAVRRVLADFRERGLITQAVGSGTFVAAGAQALVAPFLPGMPSTGVSPAELMEGRLMIEPLMPALIARNATAVDFATMAECIEKSEAAATIEAFEYWDGELHRAFAVATHNAFFLQVLELTNRVREQGEWGRLKRHSLTPERRAKYEAQHRLVVDALRDRDAQQARTLLMDHLNEVQRNLFGG
jgi:GntR family uxuAB operon transcriptional repressor